MKILFVWPNKDSFGYKPIGLSILSGIAKKLGWETKLFDTTEFDFGFIDNNQSGQTAMIYKPVDMSKYGHQKSRKDLNSEFIKTITDYKPDCISFTVLSDEVLIASQISKISKKIFPEIPVIWGGKYPTLNPEKTLKNYNVDFVCLGEGLNAFGDFLESLSKNMDTSAIPNIWMNKDGKTFKNKIRPLEKNLDSLPYIDWEIFDNRQFFKPFNGGVYKSGDHMLNWGCPYHCTYCINHFYHNMYDNRYFIRRYSVNRIIEELKYLKIEYDLEFFKFHDEDFLMRPVKNLRELSDAYKQEVNLPFVIETNPKSVTKEKVDLLKNMNCVSASIAIETGDPQIRKNLLGRVDTENDILRAFSLFKKAGIRTSSFNMLGIPFETRDTYQKTVELNRKADVQYPDMGFFYPFEGTDLRKTSIENGFFGSNNMEVYMRDRPALHFNNLGETELIEMRNVFVLNVKLPIEYGQYIKRSEKQDLIGLKLREKIIKIYEKTVFENDGWYFEIESLKKKNLSELDNILRSDESN